jgi:hypothetical protein
MQIEESETALRLFAKQRGTDVLAPTSAAKAAEIWLSFYEQVRAVGTIEDPDAWPDTLLFEYGCREALTGCYDACFYVNFTRQFISTKGEDDDAMSQLIWMLEYTPIESLKALGNRTEWCDTLDVLAAFRASVLGDSALSAVNGLSANKVDFYFTPL